MVRVALSAVWTASVVAAQVGSIDTVGGTTYDWQCTGPALRVLCNSPEYGIHVLWMYSAGYSPWPDRDMRYNFMDHSTQSWRWVSSDFMESGVNVFGERCGFGTLGVVPATGCAVASAHAGSPASPRYAMDSVPGAGVFHRAVGPGQYVWPVLGVGGNGWIHCAMVDYETQEQVWYTRCTTSSSWLPPARLSGSGAPDPAFSSHNIAAAQSSPKVCVAWMNIAHMPVESICYSVSSDGGGSWDAPVQLAAPAAFGPDTVPTFHVSSSFPFYDCDDELHIVSAVVPIVRDTLRVSPAEIWHWSGANSPPWAKVHRADCDPTHLLAPVGYNAVYACRPSIGAIGSGQLVAAWEQFDSLNVDTLTDRLRAGIWLAYSSDCGLNWHNQTLVTARNTVSHRFPCVLDYTTDGRAHVAYMDDSVAGFVVQGQGFMTHNPIVVQHLPSTSLQERQPSLTLGSAPVSVVRGVLRVPDSGAAVLMDVSGRPAAKLQPGPNDVRRLSPGVYFIVGKGQRDPGNEGAVQKVVITR